LYLSLWLVCWRNLALDYWICECIMVCMNRMTNRTHVPGLPENNRVSFNELSRQRCVLYIMMRVL
jgi:hypothetical protein